MSDNCRVGKQGQQVAICPLCGEKVGECRHQRLGQVEVLLQAWDYVRGRECKSTQGTRTGTN